MAGCFVEAASFVASIALSSVLDFPIGAVLVGCMAVQVRPLISDKQPASQSNPDRAARVN